ncbi:response regulator [Shewanella salipaludis]|uniref:Response regulator n=1 Tax=Shewanella salipaludis TaxID=2723052 RepID=A0A972JML1_9GAMM|nr:response regulator [Shewanella salipaludis]NMH66622.1 response regulator [Shewanella salipaludis]
MHYRFDAFSIDITRRSLSCNGTPMNCDDRVISLLELLIEAYPAHCDQALLLERIWPNTVVSNWSVARLISDSRKLFKAAGLEVPLIQTLHGRGYRLSHEVATRLQPGTVLDAAPNSESHAETYAESQAETHAENYVESHADAGLTRPQRAGSSAQQIAPPSASAATYRRLLRPALIAGGLLAALLGGMALWPGETRDRLEIGEPQGVKGRILWVDDHPQNNEAERQYLQRHHLAVYITSTTAEAMMLLSMYKYDAIITDMGRGEEPLAGLKLTQAVRAGGNHTPIYLYTIMPSEAQRKLVLAHGAQGIAVDSETLYLLLQPLLQRAAPPTQADGAGPQA